MYEGLDRSFPEGYTPDRFTTDHSGKLQVLSHILAQIHGIGERVVLVSNYTQVRFQCGWNKERSHTGYGFLVSFRRESDTCTCVKLHSGKISVGLK